MAVSCVIGICDVRSVSSSPIHGVSSEPSQLWAKKRPNALSVEMRLRKIRLRNPLLYVPESATANSRTMMT